VEEPGWLSRLTPPETRTLDQAIAGMYKLAGVDLVRRPVEAPAEPVPPVADEVPEHCTRRPLPAASANGSADGQAIVFGGVTIPWAQWVDWWHRDRLGEPPPPPVSVLPPAPAE